MADRDGMAERILQGTWYIARTSLPMWRESAGAISYRPLPDGSVCDVVTSRKKGKIRHIVGIDRAIDTDGWQWEWRGVQPLTFFVRSRWRVLAADANADAKWAVTLFEKTIFSAAGIDIYSRTPVMNSHGLTAAMQACADSEMAREHLAALFEPPHWSTA